MEIILIYFVTRYHYENIIGGDMYYEILNRKDRNHACIGVKQSKTESVF